MPKGHYPRECSVCRHVDRHRIELALASGRGVKSVATEFKVYWESVRRHWKVHVSPQRKAELLAGPIEIGRLAVRAAEENRSLLDYTNILRSQLFKMFQEQREAGKAYEASLIASKLLAILELIGEIDGRAAGFERDHDQQSGEWRSCPYGRRRAGQGSGAHHQDPSAVSGGPHGCCHGLGGGNLRPGISGPSAAPDRGDGQWLTLPGSPSSLLWAPRRLVRARQDRAIAAAGYVARFLAVPRR